MQVRPKTRHRTFTVSNANSFALTQTKWWRTVANTKNWTVSRRPVSKNSPRVKCVASRIANIAANKPTTIVSAVSMRFWGWHKWAPTNTDTWRVDDEFDISFIELKKFLTILIMWHTHTCHRGTLIKSFNVQFCIL